MGSSSTRTALLSPPERIWQPGELIERSSADLFRGRAATALPPGSEFGLQERPHAVSAPRAVPQARGPRSDPPVAALGTSPQVFAPRQLPSLGAGLTLH